VELNLIIGFHDFRVLIFTANNPIELKFEQGKEHSNKHYLPGNVWQASLMLFTCFVTKRNASYRKLTSLVSLSTSCLAPLWLKVAGKTKDEEM